MILWHNRDPIGIAIFASPAASLTLRSQFFRLKNPRSRVAMAALNRQLWLLQRVVIHPTYRGAGLAAAFVRRACELCDIDWIETLSAMGQINPFFEKAGFVKVGLIRKPKPGTPRNAAYGVKHCKSAPPVEFTHEFSEPVYYVRDNRNRPAVKAGQGFADGLSL